MKNANVFLRNIFESIEKIEDYTSSGKDEFMKSTLMSKNITAKFLGGKWRDFVTC